MVSPAATGSASDYLLFTSSAIDTTTGNKVALKKLASPFQSPIHAKRAYREIKLMKLLTKRNTNVSVNWLNHGCGSILCIALQIVELLDVFTPDETLACFRDM